MAITNNITVNLEMDRPNNLVLIHAVQGEYYSRKVTANLYNNGSRYTIPNEAVALIRYRKPDAEVGFYDFDPAGNRIVTIPSTGTYANKQVIFTIAPEMCDVPGRVFAHVDLYSKTSGNRLSAFYFELEVEKAATDPEIYSKANVGGVQDLIEDIIGRVYTPSDVPQEGAIIDNTLSIPGAVGDAKAMGDVVLIQDDKPDSEEQPTNKIWIDSDSLDEGTEVPDMDDFYNIIAEEYDETQIYRIDSYVIHDLLLYRSIMDILVPEAWDSTHWVRVRSTSDFLNKQSNNIVFYNNVFNILWSTGRFTSAGVPQTSTIWARTIDFVCVRPGSVITFNNIGSIIKDHSIYIYKYTRAITASDAYVGYVRLPQSSATSLQYVVPSSDEGYFYRITLQKSDSSEVTDTDLEVISSNVVFDIQYSKTFNLLEQEKNNIQLFNDLLSVLKDAVFTKDVSQKMREIESKIYTEGSGSLDIAEFGTKYWPDGTIRADNKACRTRLYENIPFDAFPIVWYLKVRDGSFPTQLNALVYNSSGEVIFYINMSNSPRYNTEYYVPRAKLPDSSDTYSIALSLDAECYQECYAYDYNGNIIFAGDQSKYAGMHHISEYIEED